jgi:predicted RNase H-like HicB family nuclease
MLRQSGKLQAQRLQFERGLRSYDPEVATVISSLELTVRSSSKEKPTRALTVPTRSSEGRSKKTEACIWQPRYNRFGGCEAMRGYEFTVVIEKDEDGRFVAICPALQGCYTEGETEEEARELIEDAIRLHVESRIARDEPIYQEVGSHKVRVAV